MLVILHTVHCAIDISLEYLVAVIPSFQKLKENSFKKMPKIRVLLLTLSFNFISQLNALDFTKLRS